MHASHPNCGISISNLRKLKDLMDPSQNLGLGEGFGELALTSV